VKIKLTPKGAKLARAIKVEPMEIFRTALESLSDAETRQLLEILLKISRRVRKVVAETS
jgi:DNA-binding MarR family transcriptional regulator